MLRLRFLNVAEGDSVLIEDIAENGVFRMLVDAGREKVEPGDHRATCSAHLAAMGVDRIDLAVITHLHADHVGGMKAVLGATRVKMLLCGYMPLSAGQHFESGAKAEKQVRGLAGCLNTWSDCIRIAHDTGVNTRELFASWTGVRLTPRLTADILVPDVTWARTQREVYNALLDGFSVSEERIIRAARLRNPNSLRVRLTYADRVIELSGDCYGSVWEHEDLMPCDILKVPHHGDAKSVTKTLVHKLRPKHSVICCSSRYQPAKDRPSAQAISLLRKAGSKVWYTDAYREGKRPVRQAASTDFLISDQGEITIPET